VKKKGLCIGVGYRGRKGAYNSKGMGEGVRGLKEWVCEIRNLKPPETIFGGRGKGRPSYLRRGTKNLRVMVKGGCQLNVGGVPCRHY